MKSLTYKELKVIGQGSHGTVYLLENNRCLKVCKKDKHMQMEYAVLKHAAGFPQFPQVYECVGNYMIREYVDGQNIREYIEKNGFDSDLAAKLLELIEVFHALGFTRLDCRLSQLFITGKKQLKIIDTTRHMDKKAYYPKKLLKGLAKLGHRESFLAYVQKFRPDYYQAWLQGIEEDSGYKTER